MRWPDYSARQERLLACLAGLCLARPNLDTSSISYLQRARLTSPYLWTMSSTTLAQQRALSGLIQLGRRHSESYLVGFIRPGQEIDELEGPTGVAWSNSYLRVWPAFAEAKMLALSSRSEAFGNAVVEANGSVQVSAHDNAVVRAFEGAVVRLHGEAQKIEAFCEFLLQAQA